MIRMVPGCRLGLNFESYDGQVKFNDSRDMCERSLNRRYMPSDYYDTACIRDAALYANEEVSVLPRQLGTG